MPFKGNTASVAFWVLLALLFVFLLLLVLVIRHLLKWQFGKGVVATCENEVKKARPKKARKNSMGDTGYTEEWLIPEVDVYACLLGRSDLHGMDIYWCRVLEFLECKSSSLLGIHGMRGVGKSTLLRLVRNSFTYHPSFRYVFYYEAGTGFTADMLQHLLAQNIGLGSTLVAPRVDILSILLRDEPFLLLLDDVREIVDLAAAGLSMPHGSRQKVIFTTRSQSICAEMGCAGNNIEMQCLGEDDAWDLFRYNVGEELIDTYPEFKDLAKQIVAECQGFPSILCSIGRSMSIMRDIKQWRAACAMIKRKPPPSNEIQEMDNERPYPHFCSTSSF
ncbi:hypothetical protein ACP70R_039014 [Stipagrostis hirtigluma subsp. patula]